MQLVETGDQILEWFSDKPENWESACAIRAVLRTIPFSADVRHEWLVNNSLLFFRSALIAWTRGRYPDVDTQNASRALMKKIIESQNENTPHNSYNININKINIMMPFYHMARQGDNANSQLSSLDSIAISTRIDNNLSKYFNNDIQYLENNFNFSKNIPSKFFCENLFLGTIPHHLDEKFQKLSSVYLSIDHNYDIFVLWFHDRLTGKKFSFGHSKHWNEIEDKAILRRLAEATDEDFWGKGHEYVNATLKGWIDEARARVAPSPIIAEASGIFDMTVSATAELGPLPTPPQESNAITYGVNDQGKLDRLPNSDQAHLRDVPDQRRAYDDLREAAAELLDEGQRLGHRLQRALDRFLHSLPDGFEDAEAYLVWRDANALRRLHRAHREAAKSPEPDEARLEPVVAEGLGGLLDLYNNFAFADDGLRAKDEARIAPQERASAEAEAKAAMPLVEAILANPEIATSEALDDILADAENAELPADDPYTDQVLDQANRTKRNWIAGLLSFGKRALEEAGKSRKEIRSGAERAVGALIVSDLAGVTSVASPLIEFIAAHASALKDYAAIAYSSFPSLSELIDRIKALLIQLRH